VPGVEASFAGDTLASECRCSADSYGADKLELMEWWLVDSNVVFAMGPEEVAEAHKCIYRSVVLRCLCPSCFFRYTRSVPFSR